jgi:hypothetical protein
MLGIADLAQFVSSPVDRTTPKNSVDLTSCKFVTRPSTHSMTFGLDDRLLPVGGMAAQLEGSDSSCDGALRSDARIRRVRSLVLARASAGGSEGQYVQ